MDFSFVKTAMSVLDEPMKALVIAFGVFSFFLIKKNSKLLDKTFEMFASHNKDLKDTSETLIESLNQVNARLSEAKRDLHNEVGRLKIQLAMIGEKNKDEQKAFLSRLDDFSKKMESFSDFKEKIESTYGKVIVLDDRQKETEKKLETTRKQLYETVKLMVKKKQD